MPSYCPLGSQVPFEDDKPEFNLRQYEMAEHMYPETVDNLPARIIQTLKKKLDWSVLEFLDSELSTNCHNVEENLVLEKNQAMKNVFGQIKSLFPLKVFRDFSLQWLVF